MVDGLDFDADEFVRLPMDVRVSLCKRLAKRAQQLADAAAPNYRESYLDIARSWLELAEEMQLSEMMEKSKIGC